MGLQKENKLKRMLANWVPKTVGTSSWLSTFGISPQLVKRYVESGWIEPIGQGAFKRPNEKIELQGALYAMQAQLGIPIHLGGPSALSSQGVMHYVRMGKETAFLFSPLKVRLPKWFCAYSWGQPVKHIKTSFLPEQLGINNYEYHDVKIRISTIERAILESLYLSPINVDLLECYQIIGGLHGIRPHLMQELLESCSSIKVKRLFLFMADKAGLPIMKHLRIDNLNLGKGARSIVKHGLYDAKFRLTLPVELMNYDKSSL